MSPTERQQFVRNGLHFGLFTRQGESIAMLPVYSDEGKLVTMRFRTDETLARGLRGVFNALAQSARPIGDLRMSERESSSQVG